MSLIFVTVCACDSHSAVPAPGRIAPDMFQRNLYKGWQSTPIKDINGQDAQVIGLAADQVSHKMWAASNTLYGVGGSLTKIAMDLKLTTYPIAITPWAITMGPDQNLWIAGTDASSNAVVARVTQTGVETDFPVPQDANPIIEQIIVGPDYALWFTEFEDKICSGGIGRIDTSGNYSFYPGGCPTSIVSGPDGNIWFGDIQNVYAMNTQGAILGTYPVGNIWAKGMAVGSDGDIYAIAETPDRNRYLFKITTGGIVAQVEGSLSPAITLANGPDGMLWMFDQPGRDLHLVSFDPIIQSWGPQIFAKPYAQGQISSGPDGNLWSAPGYNVFAVYVLQAITATPSVLTIKVGQRSEVDVTESNYTGKWTAVAHDKNIISVNPVSRNGSFNVTGRAEGSTYFSITDSMFNAIMVKVTVTQ
jgi:hypothetical protein